jgi:hypothetical protein
MHACLENIGGVSGLLSEMNMKSRIQNAGQVIENSVDLSVVILLAGAIIKRSRHVTLKMR